MFDLKLYREACGQLTVTPEKIEEMISMTENKKKMSFGHPVRVAVMGAALVAALGISAFAASPAGQEWIESVKSISVFLVTESNGDGALDILSAEVPDVGVAQKDGRTIFTVDGEEMDITEELEKSGGFTFRSDREDGGYWELKVDVEGKVKAEAYDKNGEKLVGVDLLDDTDVSYTFVVNPEELEEGETVTITDKVTAGTYTVTSDGENGITLDDGNGNVTHYDSLDDIPAPAAKD